MSWWARTLLLLCVFTHGSANADNVATAARSVVRLVVMTPDDTGEVVGVGFGSAFSVDDRKLVTNAHVIRAAKGGASIYVVLPTSESPVEARVYYQDSSKDLAVLSVNQNLPALPLAAEAAPAGASVLALGYPGNVDAATSRTFSDYLSSTDPVRSQGNVSNRRVVNGIEATLHTAAIARGNSGGPLLNECGNVVGVNSFTTASGDGDAAFGFAISLQELRAFLNAAGVSYRQAKSKCLSALEQLEARRASETAAAIVLRAEADAENVRKADLLANAKESARRRAENFIAIGILIGAFGFLGAAVGGVLLSKQNPKTGSAFVTIGLLLMFGGGGIFLLRPETARTGWDAEPIGSDERDDLLFAGSNAETVNETAPAVDKPEEVERVEAATPSPVTGPDFAGSASVADTVDTDDAMPRNAGKANTNNLDADEYAEGL